MGAFSVELPDEVIEAVLLLEMICGGRLFGLILQGEMHAFMATVLLGMAWPDALDRIAKPQPPDRETGEIAEAIGAGKRHAVARVPVSVRRIRFAMASGHPWAVEWGQAHRRLCAA